MIIDAGSMDSRSLNAAIKGLKHNGRIELNNVNGQRYICVGVSGRKVEINGTPGNDLAAFSSDVDINVNGNAQDGVANTLRSGRIVIHGSVGDVLGYSMQGGNVFVRGNVGYRAGIHMKEYLDNKPVIVIGGSAGDFMGEYMAGGTILLLNLDGNHSGNFIGTGMHAGSIFIRGDFNPYQLGKGVVMVEPDASDLEKLEGYVREFCSRFNLDIDRVMDRGFTKLMPQSSRPYGNLYS